MVAVFAMLASTPSNNTQFPALAMLTYVYVRPRGIAIPDTTAVAMSSSSSGEYPSPKIFTASAGRTVPE